MPGLIGFTIPQGPELILILGIVVLLFGAQKLPERGGAVGKTITSFKTGVTEGQAEAEAEEEVEAGDEADRSDTSSSS